MIGSGPHEGIEPALREAASLIRLAAFDFDGVLTDNMVYVHADGSESVRCFRGDGMGLRKLERLGIQTVVISSELAPVVSARCRKLGVRCIQSAGDKLEVLQSVARGELGLAMEQVAFTGNDVNDLSCLKSVGLPMVVQDAHPDVIPYARYRTRTPGGHGAVREICDMFERMLTAKTAGGRA